MRLFPTMRDRLQARSAPAGRPRHLVLPLLAAGALAMTACGSAAASGAGAGSGASTGEASFAAYSACLKQHGVTLPSFGRGGGTGGARTGGERPPSFTPGSGSFPGGGFGGGFRDNPKFKAAQTACKKLQPKGGFGGFGGAGRGGGFNSTAFAAYRNCLKLHGVTLPTGRPTGSAGSTPSTTFNTSSPTVQAAMAACASLRPSASTTTTTTAG
ncbi:MAG: hypothetical protein ACRDY1_03815 [Acidimicrobiales bacterium]